MIINQVFAREKEVSNMGSCFKILWCFMACYEIIPSTLPYLIFITALNALIQREAHTFFDDLREVLILTLKYTIQYYNAYE